MLRCEYLWNCWNVLHSLWNTRIRWRNVWVELLLLLLLLRMLLSFLLSALMQIRRWCIRIKPCRWRITWFIFMQDVIKCLRLEIAIDQWWHIEKFINTIAMIIIISWTFAKCIANILCRLDLAVLNAKCLFFRWNVFAFVVLWEFRLDEVLELLI